MKRYIITFIIGVLLVISGTTILVFDLSEFDISNRRVNMYEHSVTHEVNINPEQNVTINGWYNVNINNNLDDSTVLIKGTNLENEEDLDVYVSDSNNFISINSINSFSFKEGIEYLKEMFKTKELYDANFQPEITIEVNQNVYKKLYQ